MQNDQICRSPPGDRGTAIGVQIGYARGYQGIFAALTAQQFRL
jgi:hypothetical protein